MIKEILKPFLIFVKKIIFLNVWNIRVSNIATTIHIVRTDAIGDFILFSQILPYFKKIYPGYKIVLVANSLWQNLAEWISENKILGGADRYFDEIISVEEMPFHRNPFYYYKMLKKIRMSAPEIVIQPTFSRTPKGDQLVLISKEAEKIGYEGDLSNISKKKKEKNDKKYDRLIKNPGSPLETEKNKHFLNQLSGCKADFSKGPEWKITNGLSAQGKEFLKSGGLDLSKPIIIISPGAGYKIRHWPVDSFVSLMKKLLESGRSFQFVLTGGKNDEKICSNIENSATGATILNLCGKIGLSLQAQIFSLASLHIGNESGPMHMALAVGIPTVSLVGGGHYDRYIWKTGEKNIAVSHPMSCFNCNWKCIYETGKEGPAFCIKKITVEEVYGEAIKILNKKNDR